MTTGDVNAKSGAKKKRWLRSLVGDFTVLAALNIIISLVAFVVGCVSLNRTRTLPDLRYSEVVESVRLLDATENEPAKTVYVTKVEIVNRGGTAAEKLRVEFTNCGDAKEKVTPELIGRSSTRLPPKTGDANIVEEIEALPPVFSALVSMESVVELEPPRGYVLPFPAQKRDLCRVAQVVAMNAPAEIGGAPMIQERQFTAMEIERAWERF